MFYIREFLYRFFYSLFSFVLVLTLFFNYSDLLFWLINIFFNFIDFQQNNFFIFTHPLEIFNVSINLVLFFSFIFTVPYTIWLIFDFFKTAFYLNEIKNIKNKLNILFTYFIIINIFNFIYFLPFLWKFINNFNNIIFKSIFISMELRIENYFEFLTKYFILSNILFLILLLLYTFIFFNNLILIIKNKNILTTINIFIATLFSPPEVFFQILLFSFFFTFYEINIFLLILFKKFNKVIS